MKHIVQLGIAGFGNRMSVLGHCVDLALKHHCTLDVQWLDNSWGVEFQKYFNFNAELYCRRPNSDLGLLFPYDWTSPLPRSAANALGQAAIAKINRNLNNDIESAIQAGADTYVVCKYLASYSDSLFQQLRLNAEIKTFLRQQMLALPEEFDCWHLRGTDKQGAPSEKVLRAMKRRQRVREQVLVTDSWEAKNAALAMGLLCHSNIVPVEGSGGVHHVPSSGLRRYGLVKHDINMGLLADVFIGGVAVKFFPTCRKSTFSALIQRGRAAAWFSRELAG